MTYITRAETGRNSYSAYECLGVSLIHKFSVYRFFFCVCHLNQLSTLPVSSANSSQRRTQLQTLLQTQLLPTSTAPFLFATKIVGHVHAQAELIGFLSYFEVLYFSCSPDLIELCTLQHVVLESALPRIPTLEMRTEMVARSQQSAERRCVVSARERKRLKLFEIPPEQQMYISNCLIFQGPIICCVEMSCLLLVTFVNTCSDILCMSLFMISGVDI